MFIGKFLIGRQRDKETYRQRDTQTKRPDDRHDRQTDTPGDISDVLEPTFFCEISVSFHGFDFRF